MDHIDNDGNESDLPEALPWEDAGMSDELNAAEMETHKATLKLAERAAQGELAIQQIRLEKDLVKRAKALAAIGAVEFPDEKQVRAGDLIVMQPQPTDDNRWAAFDALFGDVDRPHINTFMGRLVDWRGQIVDDRYSMVELVRAVAAAGLRGQSADSIRRAFKEWAMTQQWNDLIRNFEQRVPEWDGKPRMRTKLIEMFDCDKSDLSDDFGQYFWLSIYNRVMNPGCLAPMVLSLFGTQNAGKSYLSKRICELVLQDKKADAVQLDLSADKNEFLREITGNSIIANVGEMTGFTRGDLNKIKSFITTTSDSMHYKYEGTFRQERQWIIVMDGNKYEGLQRDDTGNRRFYPMFVGQLPDKFGQPQWREHFSADFSTFDEDFWQIMGECAAWIKKYGQKGYKKYVDDVSKKVAAFNLGEQKRDRGTIRDDALERFLIPVLKECRKVYWDGRKQKGMFISTAEIAMVYDKFDRKNRLNDRHLVTKMAALGGIPTSIKSGSMRGYMFEQFETTEDFNDNIGKMAEADEADENALSEGAVDNVEDVKPNGGGEPHGGF